MPLDEPADIGPPASETARTPGVPGTSAADPPTTVADSPVQSTDTSTDTSTGSGAGRPSRQTPSPSPTPTGTPAPAALLTSDPVRTPTERRWCEDVTLTFRNTGGAPVRSGAVTFGTHVIDALGIDWSTVESTVELPAPLAPGARKERTWTVCVEAWRVPLGMRVETRDVSVRWE